MKENIYSRSRRRTPWTDKASVTPLESFLDNHVAVEYGRRHPRISDTMESELLNTFEPASCPHCKKGIYKRVFTKLCGIYTCRDLSWKRI